MSGSLCIIADEEDFLAVRRRVTGTDVLDLGDDLGRADARGRPRIEIDIDGHQRVARPIDKLV